MKKSFAVMVMGLLFLLAGIAQAADNKTGTPGEAKNLVSKATAYVKSKGKAAAIKAFNSPTGGFIDRDLYIFAVDLGGMTLANGGNPKLVGKSMMPVRDPQNKYFIKEMIEVAKTKGSGWVDYKWTNPVTKQLLDKTSYVQMVEDMVIGCGAYK